MIREMKPEEVLLVCGIEKACFSDPWSLKALEEGAQNRFDTFLVLEEEGTVLGYLMFRILAGEGELLRIAVWPQCQGRGYGRKLMGGLEEYCRAKGVMAVSLEVREGNKNARNLYKSYGFKEECVRKDYYKNPTEDAVIMWNRRISNIYH